MWAEDLIAGPMGFEYAVLFPRARDALFHFSRLWHYHMELPSNICPEAAKAVPGCSLVPVNHTTGMATMLSVQLYGYRERASGMEALDLDPLMTGWYDRPCAQSAIISLGRKKMLPLNGGGVFMTQDRGLADEMRRHEYFPGGATYRRTVETWLKNIDDIVQARFERIAMWDRHLGNSLVRIPMEQVMPWRVMRRVPNASDELIGHSTRDRVVAALRDAGVAVGTNYPPLPGVADQDAIRWGKEVINFLIDESWEEIYIREAARIIWRTLNG